MTVIARLLDDFIVLNDTAFNNLNKKPDQISLGITRDTGITGKTKTLTDKQRSTTVYIRGITGSGKSRLMQSMIAQDILRGHPLCLVDPTGSIYRPTAELVARLDDYLSLTCRGEDRKLAEAARSVRESLRKRIKLLDFSRPHTFRFNPLYINRDRGETAPEIVGDFMKTVSRIIGDLSETRRLKIILESACQLLAEAGGTLLDVPTLLKMDTGKDGENALKAFVQKCENKVREHKGWKFRSELAKWYMEEFFAAMRPALRIERMESTINALGVWLSDPMVRHFVDCQRGNLDFYEVLNDEKKGGHFLLCNIPLGASTDTTRVLGSLIVNKIQRQAYRRTVEQRKRPFSLYADEFHLFVDEEFAVATATVRQFGLRLLLAHQSAEQPPLNTEEGQGVLKTIMANSGAKIFFRLGVEDAREVESELFLYGRAGDKDIRGAGEGGHLVKRKFTDITRTLQQSRGFTSSSSISNGLSVGISKTKGVTRTTTSGVSVTFTEGEGASRAEVHSHGMTITQGKSQSRTISKSTGVTVTQGESETHIEATAEALGRSQSEGKSVASGSSEGSSITHSDSEGACYSTQAGSSNSHRMGEYDIAAGQMAASSGSGMSRTQSSGNAISNMNSSFKSEAKNYSAAVSSVMSASRALAEATSRSRAKTNTTGVADQVGTTETRGLSETISNGVTQIEQISRGWASSLSKAVSVMESEAKSRTATKTETSGLAVSKSKTEGESKREVIEFYTLEEEKELNAQALYTLPPRQAWIVTPSEYQLNDTEFGDIGSLDVCEFKTHTIQDSFDVKFGNTDLLDIFIEETKPKLPEREPSVFENVGVHVKDTFKSDDGVDGFN